MDVLQVIKEEHESIRGLLDQAEKNSSIAAQKQIISELLEKAQHHLQLEGDYLYPEIAGLFNEAPNFIKNWSDNHKNIKKKIKDIEKMLQTKTDSNTIKKKIAPLATDLASHLRDEESLLMPKLRQLISTQDREDLGQVFLDYRDTVASQSSPKAKRLRS